ncbi:MAG: light-responsive two component signal transduction system histidine kinase [Saliniramus fredricksonii]|uniref:Diguanylate cyclase, GGDEF domain n=1 Tax=Saliniramus fredricksonii TaxID=1653334 RepID=A0A0P7Y588_9HYPH|nr:EAL domain-containing protein [Saliniramus fredricksonii]KPQ12116.1 MAG: light-responsive two component signal transduction system histidine kinase [Saliniramus fredricksonii]SCC78710.1 Diguanylate cyclase, GGDEF domain [Saliniramus fredricksonii]
MPERDNRAAMVPQLGDREGLERHIAICEAEPITFPGRVQSFGALLAFDPTDGRLHYWSENAGAWLGRDPVPGCVLADLLPAPAIARIMEMLSCEHYAPTNFTSVARFDNHVNDAVVHQIDDLAVVELLPAGAALEAAQSVSAAQAALARLRATEGLDDLLAATAREWRALTGYDRVMVYRFDEDGHGAVVAESCDPQRESFLGLHYPASDIPSQARRMYLLQRVRMIPDIHAPTLTLHATDFMARSSTGEAEGASGAGLDMTYAVLRAVSPYHLAYLDNMGVRATLVVSLIRDGALWGMVVCHHDAPRMVDSTLRGLCDMLGQSLSEMIATRSAVDHQRAMAQRAEALRKVETALDEAGRLSDALKAVAPDLLAVMQAGGVYCNFGGAGLLLGETPPERDCKAILQAMAQKQTGQGRHHGGTHCLPEADPRFESVRLVASGAYVIPTPNTPLDGLVFFRPERTQEVAWGGDPNHPVHIDEASGKLGPRRSFAAWIEVVRGQSKRWDDVDARMAELLRRSLVSALLRITEEHVAFLGQHESETGLMTRSALEARLRRITAAAPQAHVGVMLIAVKQREAVAARHGAGAAIALDRLMRENIGPALTRTDHLGRYDDDTLMLVARRDSPEALRMLARSIIEMGRKPVEINGYQHTPLIRVGTAFCPEVPPAEAPAIAMRALREARDDNRRRIVFGAPTGPDSGPSHAELMLEIGPALARGEIRAVFQPLVDIRSGRVRGLEALARFESPTHGPVSPARFIPAAVEAGQIFLLTTTMIDLALRVAAPLIRDGKIDFVSVNLDAAALARRSISAVARSALDAHGLPYHHLVLEVTETSMCSQEAVEALRQLQAEGMKIALDDFGAGYSSLGELARLPADIVKIDRKLVSGIGTQPRVTAIFSAVRNLVASLGIACIAEGIETREECDALADEDLFAVQGYYFARPMNAEALAAFIGKAGRES